MKHSAHIIPDKTRSNFVELVLGIVVLFVPLIVPLTVRGIQLGTFASWHWVVSLLLLFSIPLWIYRHEINKKFIGGYLLITTFLAAVLFITAQGFYGNGALGLILVSIFSIGFFGSRSLVFLIPMIIFVQAYAGYLHYTDSIFPREFNTTASILTRVAVTTFIVTLAVAFLVMLLKLLTATHYELEQRNREFAETNRNLTKAIEQIEYLKRLIPICSYCHNIKKDDTSDDWIPIEKFMQENIPISMTHGMCPDCYEKKISEVI